MIQIQCTELAAIGKHSCHIFNIAGMKAATRHAGHAGAAVKHI